MGISIRERAVPMLAAAAFFMTGAAVVGGASAAGEVSLVRAASSVGRDSTIADTNSIQNAYFLILIKNIAYVKMVSVWVKNDTAWDSLPCGWLRQADDDNEYWRLQKTWSLLNGETEAMRDLEFKIEYVEGVHIYWDDNHGKNYKLAKNGGSLLNGVNVLLNRAQWALDTGLYADTSIFSGQAEVRGYKPGDALKVSFTADNLVTQDIRAAAGPPVPTWTGDNAAPDADKVYRYGFSFAGVKVPYGKSPTLHFHLIYADSAQASVDDNLAHQYALGLGMKLENMIYEELPVAAALRYPRNARIPRHGIRGLLRQPPSPLFDAGPRGSVDGIGRIR